MSAKTAELSGIISKFGADYQKTTPMKLKLIDAYLGYCFFTGVIQVFTFMKNENTIVFNVFKFISYFCSSCIAVWLELSHSTPFWLDSFRASPRLVRMPFSQCWLSLASIL